MESAFKKLNATPRLQKIVTETEEPDAIDNLVIETENLETEDTPVTIKTSGKKNKTRKVQEVKTSVKHKDNFEEILITTTPKPMNVKMENHLPTGWVKGTPSPTH